VNEPGAVVELLALLALGELQAFGRLADDSKLAPNLTRRAVLCEMAAAEIHNFRRLADRITELGGDPENAMQHYTGPLEDYHAQTEPNDYLEALTKAYVGDGLADDFYQVIAGFLGSPDRELVLEVLHDDRYAEFAAEEIRSAIAEDPRAANRLSMWARRLMGESLSQAQRVAAERPELLLLIGSQDAGGDLFRRLTSAHTTRMTAVGLNN